MVLLVERPEPRVVLIEAMAACAEEHEDGELRARRQLARVDGVSPGLYERRAGELRRGSSRRSARDAQEKENRGSSRHGTLKWNAACPCGDSGETSAHSSLKWKRTVHRPGWSNWTFAV